MYVPKKAFITKGVGVHSTKLQSFEDALRDAKIEQYNLVYVSSIFPPQCEFVTVDQGLKESCPGQILHCVMARNQTNEKGRLVGSSIGIARPSDSSMYGYISETHEFGKEERELGDFSEDLASTMLATTLGVDFDPEKDYDERRDLYFMSGKIVESMSNPCVTKGVKDKWTTVVSAVVFII